MDLQCPDYLKAALIMLDHCHEAGGDEVSSDPNNEKLKYSADALLKDWGGDLIQRSETWRSLAPRFDQSHTVNAVKLNGSPRAAIFESDPLTRQLVYTIATHLNFSSSCSETFEHGENIIRLFQPHVIVMSPSSPDFSLADLNETLTLPDTQPHVAFVLDDGESRSATSLERPTHSFTRPLRASEIYSYFYRLQARM